MTWKHWKFGMLALIATSWAAPDAWAQSEQREFNILVDGKPAGQSVVTIATEKDGSIRVTAQVDVKVKNVVAMYGYTYHGVEVWKNGKLVSLKSSGADNGKRFDVLANAETKGLHVIAMGKEHFYRADSWTTSYWKLADPKFHNKAVPLLDVDTGKEINGRLFSVGTEIIQVAAQKVQCHHFRVTGGPTAVDLWFDGQQRLVRQEFTEDGHRTIVELSVLRKSP